MWEHRKGVTTLKLIRRKDLLEVSESAGVLSSMFQMKSNTDSFLNLYSYEFYGCENPPACTDTNIVNLFEDSEFARTISLFFYYYCGLD